MGLGFAFLTYQALDLPSSSLRDHRQSMLEIRRTEVPTLGRKKSSGTFTVATSERRYNIRRGPNSSCPKHVLHPAVARAPLDTVYLDTTYLNPQYCFPPQPLVIEACAALARRAALGDELPTEAKPDVKSELGVIPDDEDNIDPDVGLDDFAGTGVGDANEDDKPDTLNLGAPTPIEEEPDEATIDAKPDVKLDPEMKPDVESEVKPEVEPNVKPDIKPDIKPDVKPELKPFIHPVEATFAEEDRSAAMMSGWLVRKNADGSVAPPKPKGRMLVLIGTYSIGKERIVKGKRIGEEWLTDRCCPCSRLKDIL